MCVFVCRSRFPCGTDIQKITSPIRLVLATGGVLIMNPYYHHY